MNGLDDVIAEMIDVGRRMAARELVVGFDGNMSVRLPEPDGRVIITRSQCRKGELTADDFVVLDLDGTQLAGSGRASSETGTHLMAYRLRPDVGAAVHAHPVECVALSVAGVELDPPLVAESVLVNGRIATVPFAAPTSGELAHAVADYLSDHDTLVLARHGSLTLGRTLAEAFTRLESLVQTARIVAMATQLGRCEPLSADEVAALEAARARYLGQYVPDEPHPDRGAD